MKPTIFILANEEPDYALHQVLTNEIASTQDGWALLLPYGRHQNTRRLEIDGQTVTQQFVQIIDEAAVDEIIANEKGTGFLQRIKRAFVRRPIYLGHPDFKQFVPNVLANEAPMFPVGLVEDYRKTDRGLEVRLSLTEAGAKAVEDEGRKYTSAMLRTRRDGAEVDGVIPVRVFQILSVGLTPQPNISGVDSLANARVNTPAAKQPEEKEKQMKLLLVGWLAAQGITLANEASDQTVLDTITKAFTTRGTELITLSNDKQALTGRVSALDAEKAAIQAKADQAAADLVLANAAIVTERKHRATALVDLAIAQGKLAIADRDARIETLANSGEKFTEQATALDKLPVTHKTTTSAADGSRKADAGTEKSAIEQVIHLANSDPRYKDIPSYLEAQAAVLRDNPALAEALKRSPEVTK